MTNIDTAEIEQSLDPFFGEGLITEILGVIRPGKEATVFCCRAGESTGRDLLAAKIYRTLGTRNFRNDAIYQPGRERVLARRERLAIAKKTRIGQEMHSTIWVNAEYQLLNEFQAAGADVPEPISRSKSALLMEFVGDGDDGLPAPMLSRVSLPESEAYDCFKRVMRNVALFLRNHWVHADLSAFNILYAGGRPVVIDFPQAVDARFNPNARALLDRDLENVCGYFARAGVRCDPHRIAADLWREYRFGRL